TCTPPVGFSFGSVANVFRTSDGQDVFTPVPANNFDGGANGYVVASDFAGPGPQNQVMAWRMSGGGAGAAPSLVAYGNIAVSTYSIPANVPQPGTSAVLDSSDARLTQAVSMTDPGATVPEGVWTQHTIAGAGGRS